MFSGFPGIAYSNILGPRADITAKKDMDSLIKNTKANCITTMDDEGLLHSYNDKPALVLKNKKGQVLKVAWYKHGLYHRECKPALIKITRRYNNNGISLNIITCYYKDGWLHSYNDKPAIIDREQEVQRFVWYTNGLHIRHKKPALVIKKNGVIKYQQWTTNEGVRVFRLYDNKSKIYFNRLTGQIHRDDGPAVVTTRHSIWYKNEKIHNDFGPAVVLTETESKEKLLDLKIRPDMNLDDYYLSRTSPNSKDTYWFWDNNLYYFYKNNKNILCEYYLDGQMTLKRDWKTKTRKYKLNKI